MAPQQDEQLEFAYPELGYFIQHELSAMAENIENNYADNIENRENNPFLRFNNSEMKKYMALGRSVDAQLGNRIQRIILFVARVKYGITGVPNVVTIDVVNESERCIVCKLYSVPFSIPASAKNAGFDPYRQVVYVGCNKSERDVKRLLKIKARSNVLETASFSFEGVSEQAFQHIRRKMSKRIPVDLLFFENTEDPLNNANAFEIKMGGNLDTKNAKSNADEVKDLYDLFAFLPSNHAYFATCYGTCSDSVSTKVAEKMGEGAVLNGQAFWDKIIPDTPETFDYDDFIRIYNAAFILSRLEDRLSDL